MAKTKDLKKGDTVEITRTTVERKTVLVESASNYNFSDRFGNVYRVAADDPYEREGWAIVKHTPKVNPKPTHWPPQRGDVWRGKNGTEYHQLGIGDSAVWTHDNAFTNHDEMLKDSVTLVYRKGNTSL